MTQRVASTPGPILIGRSQQIDELRARCRAEGRFAFDTEFVMEDRYETEVCLVQVATRDHVAIIDPLSRLDLSPFWDLVSDASVEKVVHAGQEDLALCVQQTGQPPRSVFDVQIAAGLSGLDYPISLQKLVLSVLRIRLHKHKTLTDWRRRPLTAAQIQYAADDVCHLLALRDHLHAKLSRLRRLDWAREEFQSFESLAFYRRAEQTKLLHTKGSGALRGRQLAVLQRIVAWRDELARARNRPPRSVLRDHLVVEIAKRDLQTAAEIRELRGIHLSDRDLHALCRTVKSAAQIPPEQWPAGQEREMESPGEAVLVPLLTAVVRDHCARNELAHGLVATKRSLSELVRHHFQAGTPTHSIELLGGWRRDAVGRMLQDVLSGKLTLRVTQENGEPKLEAGGRTRE